MQTVNHCLPGKTMILLTKTEAQYRGAPVNVSVYMHPKKGALPDTANLKNRNDGYC